MRNLYITFILLSLFLLAACGKEETSVKAEKQIGSDTAESEYITATADYARNASQNTEELDKMLSDLEFIESSEWQRNLDDLLSDFDMIDVNYTLAETFLSKEQYLKYDSTSELQGNAQDLITNISDELSQAAETYDKKKIEELRQQIPAVNEELTNMREQLEVDRYE